MLCWPAGSRDNFLYFFSAPCLLLLRSTSMAAAAALAGYREPSFPRLAANTLLTRYVGAMTAVVVRQHHLAATCVVRLDGMTWRLTAVGLPRVDFERWACPSPRRRHRDRGRGADGRRASASSHRTVQHSCAAARRGRRARPRQRQRIFEDHDEKPPREDAHRDLPHAGGG